MLLSKAVTTDHYNNHLETYKKLVVVCEFLLSEELEDTFVRFLGELELSDDPFWSEFSETIQSLKSEFEITSDEINQTINSFIKLPAS